MQQPYQEASDEIIRQSKVPGKIAKEGIGIAATAIAGGSILGRALPFLNKFVPQDLAIKGLSKIDPRLGNFASKALSAGQDWDNISSFIKGKAEDAQEENSNKPKENRNIIQQYSDKLHEFLEKTIKKGLTPAQAVSLIEIYPEEQKAIKQIEKDHKIPFVSLVEQIYGGNSATKQQTEENPQGQMQQGAQQQAQPGGGVDPALMQIMQQMQSTMQKFQRK
jgi:hypothetical protein